MISERARTIQTWVAVGLITVFMYGFTSQVVEHEQALEEQLAAAQDLIETQRHLLNRKRQVVVDESELLCMARNVFFEARGESITGKLAVAHVTLNRVRSQRFPNTVCDVVKQARTETHWRTGSQVPVRHKCQFSWYCDGKSDEVNYHHPDGTLNKVAYQNWIHSFNVAKDVLQETTSDPTHGSTHYYNPALADPYWKDNFEEMATVGGHVFLR